MANSRHESAYESSLRLEVLTGPSGDVVVVLWEGDMVKGLRADGGASFLKPSSAKVRQFDPRLGVKSWPFTRGHLMDVHAKYPAFTRDVLVRDLKFRSSGKRPVGSLDWYRTIDDLVSGRWRV